MSRIRSIQLEASLSKTRVDDHDTEKPYSLEAWPFTGPSTLRIIYQKRLGVEDTNILSSFHPATSSYTMYRRMRKSILCNIGSTYVGGRSSERMTKSKRQLTWTHQYTLGSTQRTCLAFCFDVYKPIESFMVFNSPFFLVICFGFFFFLHRSIRDLCFYEELFHPPMGWQTAALCTEIS